MQTDPSFCLSIKLTDQVPIREIEVETEAKTTNVSISNIDEMILFSSTSQLTVDENFISQLQAYGLYEQYLANASLANDPNELVVTGLMCFLPIWQLNLIATNEFHDVLDNLPNRSQPLDLANKQALDETIKEVLLWKSRGHVDASPNLPTALRKYRKQFPRLVVEDKILYRLFFDDCGKLKHKQYCVPKFYGGKLSTACIIPALQVIWAVSKR